MKNDKVKGGKSDKLTPKDIANKFNVSVSEINSELIKGTKIESEHTDDKEIAREIALDHLSEIPDYYTNLNKMEKESKKKWKVSEGIGPLFIDLFIDL